MEVISLHETDRETDGYHPEIGVQEGTDGDLFVVTESEKLLLSRDEALQLAGMLMRNADGGFQNNVSGESRIGFADMALDIRIAPDGTGGGVVGLDHYEFLDEGEWAWYSDDTDAVLEFVWGIRDGFELPEAKTAPSTTGSERS